MESHLRRAASYLRFPVGLIALAGLLIAGVVHAASLRGIDVETASSTVWALHYAIFPILVLAIIDAAVVAEQKRLRLRAFLALVPVPARIVLALVFLYAFASFVIVTPLSGWGDPLIVDGRFFFNDHGVVREVSQEQFRLQRSFSLRLYAAFWIYLYLFSTIYLLGARRPSASHDSR